uniref:Uncharacterized protein n=1 Tax=Amphimedon queenslandica TaxID=400682 RepID=A0A1X7T8P9_AMPQE
NCVLNTLNDSSLVIHRVIILTYEFW